MADGCARTSQGPPLLHLFKSLGNVVSDGLIALVPADK